MTEIAGSAVIDPQARIGENCSVGHGSVVYGNVDLGADAVVGEFCVIGEPTGGDEPPLSVGKGALIRSHTVLYEGSRLGGGLQTGHHCLIRAGAQVGENLRLGSYSSLEGELQIGDYVRIHGYAQVGAASTVGNFVWIYSLCTLTNDPLPPSNVVASVIVEDGAVVCPATTLMPGSRIGRGAFVAAGSMVVGDVPAATVHGRDGRLIGPVSKLMNLESGVRHPWPRHFTEGYPEEALSRLETLRDEILEDCKNSRFTSD